MNEQRRSGHALTRFTAHLVWVTKYRYPVLKGDVQGRCRSLIIQICDVEYPPKLSISDLVKRLKGRTSWVLQQEFPQLKKRYWGRHFWAIGYGGWSTGNITDEMVQEYLEHHRNPSNKNDGNMILE